VMFEGSGMWYSIIFVVVMVFLIGLSGSVLLRPLLWWHRELFFGWTTVDANVGGSENRMESPNTRITNESAQVTKDGETKNLWKPVLISKVVNPFTRALAPPFIGRRRDFLSREYPQV
jgi:hypothetical protein